MRTKIRLEITLLLLVVCMAGCTLSRSDDGKRFDQLQADFEADPEAFEEVVAVMYELLESHPDAARIGYTLKRVSILPEGKTRASIEAEKRDTTPEEEMVFRGLSNASGVVYQAKDGERFIIRYDLDQPPVYHLMYAPNDDDPEAFAKEREFRSFRKLNEDWSLFGPLPSVEAINRQWLE